MQLMTVHMKLLLCGVKYQHNVVINVSGYVHKETKTNLYLVSSCLSLLLFVEDVVWVHLRMVDRFFHWWDEFSWKL